MTIYKWYTSRGGNSVKIVCSPFGKWDNFKRNEIFSFYSCPIFQIKFGGLEGKQEDTKVVSFVKQGG